MLLVFNDLGANKGRKRLACKYPPSPTILARPELQRDRFTDARTA